MLNISQEEFNSMLYEHQKWLYSRMNSGKRAIFYGLNLKGFNFKNKNISYAIFDKCDLRYANFEATILRSVVFSNTDLTYAHFKRVILNNADLSTAIGVPNNLMPFACPQEGSFIGFKKVRVRRKFCCDNEGMDAIAKLKITENAKRSSATSNKCRCSEAEVLEIKTRDGCEFDKGISAFSRNPIIYEVGKIVKVDDFDENRWNECSSGIHFFLTKQEAIQY